MMTELEAQINYFFSVSVDPKEGNTLFKPNHDFNKKKIQNFSDRIGHYLRCLCRENVPLDNGVAVSDSITKDFCYFFAKQFGSFGLDFKPELHKEIDLTKGPKDNLFLSVTNGNLISISSYHLIKGKHSRLEFRFEKKNIRAFSFFENGVPDTREDIIMDLFLMWNGLNSESIEFGKTAYGYAERGKVDCTTILPAYKMGLFVKNYNFIHDKFIGYTGMLSSSKRAFEEEKLLGKSSNDYCSELYNLLLRGDIT